MKDNRKLSKTIGIRISDELYNKFNDICWTKRRRLSDLARMIIEDYIKQFDDITLVK